MTDLPTLARSLTKAGKAHIIGGEFDYVDPNTIRALRRKGIIADHCLRLTATGLALRAYLKDQQP